MEHSPILQAFKYVGVPVFTIASDGSVSHSNTAADNLFGYTNDSMTGQKISHLLPVESVAELHSFIHPPAIDANIRMMMAKSKDGSPLPLAVYLTSWTDEKGLQHAVIVRDISEEMKLQKVTTNELKRANTAILAAKIGVFEHFPKENRTVVSQSWRHLIGLADDDTADVQEEWRSRVHPDDLGPADKTIQVCLDGDTDIAKLEYRFRSKDDTHWFWLCAEISVSQRDEEGRITSVIGVVKDVTERRKTEDSLRLNTEYFRSAFENTSIGHAIIALDGRWLRVNNAFCELIGFPREELVKTNLRDLTHPDDLEDSCKHIALLTAGEIETYSRERRYIRANGQTLWGKLTVSLVRDENGVPDHIIVQLMDITEQRQLAQMKGEFVATISHELRTPLTSVIGSLALLTVMDDEAFSDKAKRLLHVAQQNGKRLNVLIDDILDFEKFSAKQVTFNLSSENIAELVEDTLFTNSEFANKFGVRFELKCDDASLRGSVDVKRFQQVMANLLSNAAKFAHDDTAIIAEVKDVAGCIEIAITNKGDGIPNEFRDRIFIPFAQAAESDNRNRGGTGLGLTITKQIVEQTGGQIGYESMPDGMTTFWFTVPYAEPAEVIVLSA